MGQRLLFPMIESASAAHSGAAATGRHKRAYGAEAKKDDRSRFGHGLIQDHRIEVRLILSCSDGLHELRRSARGEGSVDVTVAVQGKRARVAAGAVAEKHSAAAAASAVIARKGFDGISRSRSQASELADYRVAVVGKARHDLIEVGVSASGEEYIAARVYRFAAYLRHRENGAGRTIRQEADGLTCHNHVGRRPARPAADADRSNQRRIRRGGQSGVGGRNSID